MLWIEPRAYRCEQCGETSPDVYSRRALEEVQHEHRVRAHGGFIPDGEVILEPERRTLADWSREQTIAGAVLLAVVLVSLLAKVA